MVHTLQVTLGSGATPIIPSGEIVAKWVIFENNATHIMRVGDSNVSATRGFGLSQPGGSANEANILRIPESSPTSSTKLSAWYAFGTAADVLDVIYDDGV